MNKIILSVTLLCWCTWGMAQKAKLPSFVTDSLDTYITTSMNDWNIPGLSVAIVKDGEVAYMKGFGVTSIGSKKPVDENTLFMIGSNTKAFTSLALTMIQQPDKFNLNDKVKKWLPEFKLKNSLASEEATITDMITHRIGFETFQGDFIYWDSNLSRAEVIEKMGLIEAPYGFRTRWGYCNAGYVVAGEVIERVIGQSWEDTVKDSILVPLKMYRTFTLADHIEKEANIAAPHTLINNNIKKVPVNNVYNLAPAGSMVSSAKDLTQWLLAHLNKGKIEGEQVLPEKRIHALKRPATILGMNTRDHQETHFYLYGLGLMINDRDGKLTYSHTGGVDGFVSSFLFVPEEQLGIVVLTNTDHNKLYQDVTNEIRDAFLGLPYQDYHSKSLKLYKQNKATEDARIDSLNHLVSLHEKPPLSLKQYTGKYKNEAYGEVEIKLIKGKLAIHFSNHPNLIGQLAFLQEDTFLCTFSKPIFGIVEIPFVIDDQAAKSFTLKVADFIEFTSYDFFRIK